MVGEPPVGGGATTPQTSSPLGFWSLLGQSPLLLYTHSTDLANLLNASFPCSAQTFAVPNFLFSLLC